LLIQTAAVLCDSDQSREEMRRAIGPLRPQLAAQADSPPDGRDWVHEIKVDGYRTLAYVEAGRVRLVTRGGHDWTSRYGVLADAFATLPCAMAVLDGEVAVPNSEGGTRLDALQNALKHGNSGALAYFAFDLLHLDGRDLTGEPLLARKAALARLLEADAITASVLLFSQHHTDGNALFAEACAQELEGIVSKRADAPYVGKRSTSWLKVKRQEQGRFVVIGFLSNQPGCASSLILAEDRGGGLEFSCRVNAGAQARALHELLQEHARPHPVVATPKIRGATWVQPTLEAHIVYNGRNDRQTPRAPVFLSYKPFRSDEAGERDAA